MDGLQWNIPWICIPILYIYIHIIYIYITKDVHGYRGSMMTCVDSGANVKLEPGNMQPLELQQNGPCRLHEGYNEC